MESIKTVSTFQIGKRDLIKAGELKTLIMVIAKTIENRINILFASADSKIDAKDILNEVNTKLANMSFENIDIKSPKLKESIVAYVVKYHNNASAAASNFDELESSIKSLCWLNENVYKGTDLEDNLEGIMIRAERFNGGSIDDPSSEAYYYTYGGGSRYAGSDLEGQVSKIEALKAQNK